MANREPLETNVRRTVAFDILGGSLGSWGRKAGTRRDKVAGLVAEALKEDEKVPDGVIAYTEDKRADVSSTSEAIEVFKAKHPDLGNELQDLINRKRQETRNYVVVAVAEGYRLTPTDYTRVMVDLGMTMEEARALYEPIMEVCVRLDEANFGEKRSILLKK